ncbi:TetR family transcriptional regulator [Thermosipho melanesiensis]|uniref:Transcriptional regulator, TetR family n=2 Tax=Thermosipho melanesiensis TaxID=46541 RepID=A6LK73_THEM4|nr:TetR/AcrR family transcriptional regulator [Thermosipho melanesiensis]ABR30324.1 transcriptional regulator, TetR family [Thermosipho melanesiensis BI429]APT73490.1 TetR family transcriptional regulator [Thermosipho melanesiensis]OOC37442.1 TetR family transcriptional regulator [Thermosipho melanesiensis]OOC39804.1 TetR family transcriptional regulator [Thermosipho melanesiensis]OOC39909.1 TetR family transcriptional regulator [Thermosipho melanesiensis]
MREKILNIAIEEFAKKGYFGASTNVISKKANVSKGALFYHFKSKEGLYIECFKSFIQLFELEFLKFYNENDNLDFFTFLLKWSQRKVEMTNEMKYVLDFFETIKNIPKNIEEKIQDILSKNYEKYIPFLWEKFEKLNLRKELDKKFAFSMVLDFFETFSKRYYKTTIEPKKIFLDFKNVMEIIKYGILE